MAGGNPSNLTLGAGTLYIAPLSSTEPVDLVSAWPVAWTPLGYTADGSSISYDLKTATVEVAEELDPVLYVTTSRAIKVSASLAEITATNLKRALNGGTVVTGSGFVTFTPPVIGAETRVMVGWQALDGKERWSFRKTLQTGVVKIDRKKAPAYSTIPVEFSCEVVSGVDPFKAIFDNTRA